MADFAGTTRHELPPAAHLAELMRNGATLAELGAAHGTSGRAIQGKLNRSGYTRGGRPAATTEPRPHRVTKAASAEMPRQGDWHASRACDGSTADLFFPTGYGAPQQEIAAKAICADCRVKVECLAWALIADKTTRPDDRGICGGLTGKERAKLRNKTRRPKASA